MATQMQLARKGIITEAMKQVAAYEGVTEEFIRKGVAEGTIAIPLNINHKNVTPRGVGQGLSVKVNANIGTSSSYPDPEPELEKLAAAIAAGADSVMDLSTGDNIDASRRAIIGASTVMVGTVPIYQATVETIKKRGAVVEMTKEDLEELIVILKRGMPKKQQDGSVLYEPSADSAEIIESLSEELRNAPNEEYIPIADYDPTFPCNVVFKNSLEQNVYVFADENQMEIFPKNAGTIQLQSWIIKNGGWDGEGPVVLEPVLSKEEALTISKNVLSDLKIEGFEAAHIEAARMLDGFFGYATVSVGYQITFCRAIDGQIPFDSSILTPGVLGFEDEADYIKPWPQERIVLMVDQEGIRFFHWEYPVIITNKLESNMKPLSFEAVWQHAKDLLILGSSWVADATTVEDRHVTRIMLTNCMVRSTKERNKVFLIPTWLFIVQKESALDGHILPSYIAINALDGSRVEMHNNFS